MKTLIFLLFTSSLYCQEIKFKLTDKDKKIIMLTGASVSVYGFLRKDESYQQFKTSNLISVSGVVFAALPLILDQIEKCERLDFENGKIVYKFGRKKFKCYSGIKKITK